ncbi:hypothetical protein [Natronogracilivirga saccharolytica]|nr:hypothetical protein [Natronogracilivirga saccharolytica]
MTDDEIRESLNEAIRKGLVPYMLRTPYASQFSVDYDEVEEEIIREEDDPWNYWVFEVYAGRFQFRDESKRTDFDSRWGFFADRVTEEWNLRFRPYFNYHYTRIEREDEDDFINRHHRHGINSYAIKSLTEHWSAALFADYITRDDRNLEHRFRITPGIEYSLFPYQEATRRAVKVNYRFGYTHANYYERTIFDKTTENLFLHELQLRAEYQQPWGSINAGITGSHYFHDFDLRKIQTFGQLSVRLAKGLSLSLQLDYDLVQDQVSLPIGDAALEDVLLDQRELATDYSFRGLIALSYTFGSDFANIVNTRF